MTTGGDAFAAAAAAHLGFQATVTVLVYPSLARVPAAAWRAAHERHSRAIAPLVGLVYGALAGTGIWSLAAAPTGTGIAAVGCAGATLALTAAAAAPLHGRLTGKDPQLLGRLLVVDRLRLALAAACLALALTG